jgi:hypothetical protein
MHYAVAPRQDKNHREVIHKDTVYKEAVGIVKNHRVQNIKKPAGVYKHRTDQDVKKITVLVFVSRSFVGASVGKIKIENIIKENKREINKERRKL